MMISQYVHMRKQSNPYYIYLDKDEFFTQASMLVVYRVAEKPCLAFVAPG